MVCWPLRSAQNKAIGTTVHSFGGLTNFTGTLVGPITKGANGVTSSDSAATSINIGSGNFASLLNPAPRSNWTIGLLNVSGVSTMGCTFGSPTAGYEIWLSADSNNNTMSCGAWAPLWLSANGVSCAAAPNWCVMERLNVNDSRLFSNATAVHTMSGGNTTASSVSINASATIYGNGRMGAGDIFVGTTAFVFISNSYYNGGMYTLYKSTLGKDLSLP